MFCLIFKSALCTFLCLQLLGYVQGDCPPSFFAKPIKYDDAVKMDFYYTGINLASPKACAEFCSQREFCHSAVYNVRTKTCGISYEYTVACASNQQRFKTFNVAKDNSSDLILIACVDQCKSDSFSSSNNIELEKVPIGIITGEPNDGNEKNKISTVKKNQEKATKESLITTTTPPSANRSRADGYVTRLVLANISGLPGDGVGSVEPLTLPQNDGSNHKESKNNKEGKSQICYRTIRHRMLSGASIVEKSVASINECRCLCAATFRDPIQNQTCQSFQYKGGQCSLNKGNHFGHYDLVEKRKSVYQYVDCDINVLLEVASGACENFKNQKIVKTNVTTEEKTPKPKLITTTEKLSTSQSDKKTPNKTTTLKPDIKKVVKSNKNNATETTTTAPKEKNQEKVQPKVQRKSNETNVTNESLEITKNGCFEVIHDHLMVSVAGGLEHDVSIEECQCICANSKKSGKYDFQCTSATYYQTEKDCILNLEDRFMKSQLFEKQFKNFNVSYIGFRCPIEETIKSVVSTFGEKCGIENASVTTSTSSSSSFSEEKKPNDVASDSCYVELKDFVLEGTAIAVETGVTPQECKCKCAEGEKLYGEECASFLYYFDSNTCLINKENRFSNPEKFNFVPSINQSRSYFEWTCANKNEKRIEYYSDVCNFKHVTLEGNLLNNEGDAIVLKKDVSKTVDDGTVRMKRLDEKLFLEKIDKIVVDNSEENSTKKADDKEKAEDKNVAMIKIKSEELLKKIEEASSKLEVQENDEKHVEVETTKKDVEVKKVTVTKTEKKSIEKQNTEKVKASKVEKNEKASTSQKLEPTANKNDFKSSSNKIEVAEPKMKKVNENLLKKLLSVDVPKDDGFDSSEENTKQTVDPTKVIMKRVETDILNKLAKLEVDENVSGESINKNKENDAENLKPVPASGSPKRKYSIPEAEGIESEDVEESIESELSTELFNDPIEAQPTKAETTTTVPTTPKAKISGVKTHKFDEKVDKYPIPDLITTTVTTTTTDGYPSAGRCSFSALYQTAFLGRRLLKTVRVKTPADCFAACYALRCRSANLISEGELNSCELYRDSLIDYRRPDMIGYEAQTVYFDGIRCDGTPI